MQQVQTALLPFDKHHKRSVNIPEGLTLKEMLNALVPDVYGSVDAVITVNGERVPEEMWGRIRPKRNAVVLFNIIPMGGGRKNPLTTIISIVALVAAPYLAGVYGAGLASALSGVYGPVTAGQLAFAQGLIRVGVGLVAYAAKAALSDVPTQSNVNTDRGISGSPTQYIEGSSNIIDPWGVVPICLGTNRMFMKQGALPYTETQSNDQYVRQLMTYGFGKVQVSDRKIGETPIGEFTEVEVEEKLNGDLSDGLGLYANDIFQEDLNIGIVGTQSTTTPGDWVTRRTQENVDEFEVDISFPRGLYFFHSDGNIGPLTAGFDLEYSLVDSGVWTSTGGFEITDTNTNSIRRRYRYTVPNGQYDVRIRRTTYDYQSTLTNTKDDAFWSALRSVTYANPVLEENTSGFAIRMKATDQLNGTIDKLNDIVSSVQLDYDPNTSSWVERVSSNPASLYRYVLQSEAFKKRIPDNLINLTKLEEWWVYCDSLGLTYNRIIDYETSVEEVLNDICAAGFATRYAVEGVHSVIIDNEKPIIKGVITPRNSWGYKGSISYPEIPHALRIEYRNKNKGYAIDERIIYSDGYSASNATLFERIEFSSCTDPDLAYIYGRRYLANIKLQPEIHTFYMDPESMSFNRGDRITLVNDVILVGIGSARIKEVVYDDDESPTEITGIVLDDTITIPSVSNFAARIRYTDASGTGYHLLTTTVGETNTLMFTTPFPLINQVKLIDEENGALCAFVEDGNELDLLVLEMSSENGQDVQISAINYAPERFIIDNEPIPVFESNVTLPLSSYRPEPPLLTSDPQSDENVMIRNIDGSYISRMIIPLTNRNGKDVEVVIKSRRSGLTGWIRPEVLSSTPEEIIITGLQDGIYYDFDIFYQRLTGNGLLSKPLSLRNVKFVGGSEPPADVSTFRIDVADDNVAILTWTANDDIDLSHYEVRYSNAYSGATWGTAQILEEFVYENRLPLTFRGGTYFIKAVDFLGNESENATQIITYNPGQIRNVIEEIDEHPSFSGTTDNVQVVGSELQLIDTASDGYYYFSGSIDLGYVDRTFLSSNLTVNGQFINDVFDFTDVFAVSNIFPSGDDLDLFSVDDIFAIEDMFGIGTDSWYVELQFRTTNDDPTGSPTWSDWAVLTAGFKEFRVVEFRLLMRSLQSDVTPSVSVLSVTGDVPDRTIRGKDLTVPVGGYTLTYNPEFTVSPTVLITLQDSQDGDDIEFITKTSSEFSFRVYNSVSMSYVERTFDYAVLGYGRKS